MSEIICVTGFLGSGKTTLLNKVLPLCLKDKKVAVIENDFGDAGIDAGLVAETGAAVRELASGCICCSLRGELKSALKSLIEARKPELIFIEPSGLSRSSDVLSVLKSLEADGQVAVGNVVNLVDLSNFEDFIETFGDFYGDQIRSARTILFSHQRGLSLGGLDDLTARIRELNDQAACLTSDWLALDSGALWDFIKDAAATGLNKTSHENVPGPGRVGTGVFSSWSGWPDHVFSREELEDILASLAEGRAGPVLRAKGFCRAADVPGWHFEYLKGHGEIEPARSVSQGRALVIGQNLNTEKLAELFKVQVHRL